jgi:hypothetical protein
VPSSAATRGSSAPTAHAARSRPPRPVGRASRPATSTGAARPSWPAPDQLPRIRRDHGADDARRVPPRARVDRDLQRVRGRQPGAAASVGRSPTQHQLGRAGPAKSSSVARLRPPSPRARQRVGEQRIFAACERGPKRPAPIAPDRPATITAETRVQLGQPDTASSTAAGEAGAGYPGPPAARPGASPPAWHHRAPAPRSAKFRCTGPGDRRPPSRTPGTSAAASAAAPATPGGRRYRRTLRRAAIERELVDRLPGADSRSPAPVGGEHSNGTRASHASITAGVVAAAVPDAGEHVGTPRPSPVRARRTPRSARQCVARNGERQRQNQRVEREPGVHASRAPQRTARRRRRAGRGSCRFRA